MPNESLALSEAEAPAEIVNGNGHSNGGVLGLFEKAIDKLSGEGAETAVAVLGKLMDLHERVQDREAARAFNTGMVEFQKQCPSIPKNRTAQIATKKGGKFSYKYADTDIIRKTVKPILNGLGFSYSFDQEPIGNDVWVCFILSHQDGETRKYRFQLVRESDSAASPQQKIGIGDTYASRRAMQNGLGITLMDESDTDGAAHDEYAIKPTEHEIRDLQSLAEEVKADMKQFLDFFGITKIDDIPKSQLPKAISMLNQKKRSQQ